MTDTVRTLITGGAGFIGSHLAERLVQLGHQVRILDNLSSGSLDNLRLVADRVTFVDGDIRDVKLLEQLSEGCEWVFHQAAVVSVPFSVEHPQATHDVNIQGTLNVLLAARNKKVKRVLFASSAAIYGDDPELPKHERLAPAPVSPYGVEKTTGEHYMRVFHKLYGVQTVALRYFNVYGPRQNPGSPYSGVISIFVDRALRGDAPHVFGDGEQYRDFVYVSDVVDANILSATTPCAAGRCYNIGRGERTTLNHLLETLGRRIGRTMRVEHHAPRVGDIRQSLADISRARLELGYDPGVDVSQGLARLLDHARSVT